MNYVSQSNFLDEFEIEDQVEIEIKVVRAIFIGREDYGVYMCEDKHGNDIKITISHPLISNQSYNIKGTVAIYRGEKQIRVNVFEAVKPSTKKGYVQLLTSLKGIGKKTAESIYANYGENSIEILLKNPHEVVEKIKKISSKNISSWKESLKIYEGNYRIFAELLNLHLSDKQSKKVYELYGNQSINKLKENPYRIHRLVKGVTFWKCDEIASKLGIFNPESKYRIQTCIFHELNEAKNSGHCFLPQTILLKNCNKTLSNKVIDVEDEITKQLQHLSTGNQIVLENHKVYLKSLHDDELKVAEYIKILAKEQSFKKSLDLNIVLERLLTEEEISLEEKQRESVLRFSEKIGGFFILTGSAGCGKTFTILTMLKILEKQYKHNGKNFSVRLLAPTGKASKVASKSTGMDCVTVHRGLGYNGIDAFEFNEDNPLDVEVVIVDESSMLDITLTRQLLSALKPNTKVIFLGDTKQLPSIGPGNVLKDIISSQRVEVVTLNVVKRQKGISGIIINANNITQKNKLENFDDAQIICKGSSEEILKHTLEKIETLITNDAYSINDIQILTPKKSDYLGTYHLNYQIQQKLNPASDGLSVINKAGSKHLEKVNESLVLKFKVGDKVMHTKNNYDIIWYEKDEKGNYDLLETKTEITNGESGIIEKIVKMENEEGNETTRLIVCYEDGYVFYDDFFEEIEHAFAMSIHKSQGSQWKVVIILIADEHGIMRNNNLFYTGYTRAEELNIVIGQSNSINHSIRNERTTQRYTDLSNKLK